MLQGNRTRFDALVHAYSADLYRYAYTSAGARFPAAPASTSNCSLVSVILMEDEPARRFEHAYAPDAQPH